MREGLYRVWVIELGVDPKEEYPVTQPRDYDYTRRTATWLFEQELKRLLRDQDILRFTFRVREVETENNS